MSLPPMINMKPVLQLGRLSGTYGFKPVGETSYVDRLVVNSYRGHPSFVYPKPKHASTTTFIGSSHGLILHVLSMINSTNVRPSVIGAILVNMVDVLFREVPCHIQIGKTVSPVEPAAYSDMDVTHAVIASNFANNNFSASLFAPSKNTSLRAVVKYFFKVQLCQFHRALQSVVELGAGRISVQCPPLYHGAR